MQQTWGTTVLHAFQQEEYVYFTVQQTMTVADDPDFSTIKYNPTYPQNCDALNVL